MKKTILVALGLLITSNLYADDHAEKIEKEVKKEVHIIVKSASGDMPDDIAALIKKVEAEAEGDENFKVFVTKDESGNIDVRKEATSVHGPHKAMKIRAMPFGHHRDLVVDPVSEPMTQAAAECVIKHIGKVNNDGAAALLQQACRDLNP